MRNTVAWMITGGRRFDARWEAAVRHRAALLDADRIAGRPSLQVRLRAAVAAAASPAGAVDTACCAA